MLLCLLTCLRLYVQLTEIDVRGCPRACTPTAFGHLSRLHHLRRLSAQGCRLQPDAITTLAAITTLTHVNLADNPSLGDVAGLRTLRALELLDVSDCALSDDQVAPLLASLPQLRTVIMGGNPLLTGGALQALAAGPARTSLKTLVASGLQLENETLEQVLPQLSALCTLDVSGNQSPLALDILLAAARAAPSLHTLVCYGLESSWTSTQGLHDLRTAGSGYSPLRIVM